MHGVQDMAGLILLLVTDIDNGRLALVDDLGGLGIGDFRALADVGPDQCTDTIQCHTDKKNVVSNKIHGFILQKSTITNRYIIK